MTTQGYFDYNATTPVCSEAVNAFINAVTQYANPSSKYGLSKNSNHIISDARTQVANLIGADAGEVFFTSGGTESNNWAIKGVFFQQLKISNTRKHLIVSEMEHSSVLEVCAFLEREFDCTVTRLKPNSEGIVPVTAVAEALRPETLLVSVMMVNNEVGSMQPIQDIAWLLRGKKIHFHVDAVQAVGKIPVDVRDLGVDTMSFSGHKFYAPKGIGGLYIREGVKITPLLHGGGQERGLRGGTEAIASVAAIGAAAQVTLANINDQVVYLGALRELLKTQLISAVPQVYFHGPVNKSLQAPNTLSVCIPGIRAEALAALLDNMHCIQVSLGAACSNNKSVALSHVLVSMGLAEEVVKATLRVSIGQYTTESDIHRFVQAVATGVTTLFRISKPASQSYVTTA